MKNKLISFCVVFFIIFFAISLLSEKDSDNNTEEYEDLTNHKCVEFTLNDNDTYTMNRNLFKKVPDVIVIPETYQGKPVTVIDGDFSEFNIIKVFGSKNLITIRQDVFGYKSDISHMDLEQVVFPHDGQLTTIETDAFFKCHKMHTIVLPENFQCFEIGAFYGCDALSTMVIYSKTPPTGATGLFADKWNDGFSNKPDVPFTVYVPDDAVETYKQSSWRKYSIEPISSIEHIIEFPSTTSDIANNEQLQKDFGAGHVIAISISGAILLALCIIAIIDYKKCKIVLKNSERIKRLLELNKTVNFRRIQSRYNNQQACNSKRQLDNLSLDDYLLGLITSNESFYRNIVESISFNRNKYYSYIRETGTIRTTATEEFCKELGFSLKSFIKYENRIFKWKKLRKPQFNVTVHCKVTYTSPQGRNHYWKEESYNFDELKRLYDYIIELKAQRQTRQYQIKVERAKMTDSLRYDILKRDNFRCQVCGSCASDGVKLHVDHIIPVAKGGQTIASNLRTLCDRCNMGKSDKM